MPFFTTNHFYYCNGLCLDIVYLIVTRHHNGQITVSSVPGKTCFRVALPISGPPT